MQSAPVKNPKINPARVRLSLDVSHDVRDSLNRLAQVTDSHSITEVIRRAVAIYDIIVEEQAKGTKLVFRQRDGEEETIRVL